MNVIIVGGDMVSVTLALVISQLSHGTLPVHLIKASEPETDHHPGFDARIIALMARIRQQPAGIGIWQVIADYATAVKTVHVDDRGHTGFVTLGVQEYRIPALGQVAELHDVGLRLFTLLRKIPGITLYCLDRVAHASHTQGRVEVTLENGEMIISCLLVAAGGTRSALTTVCGIDWLQQPYGQPAMITNVTTSVPHNGRAFKRFTQHDPPAMLPISDGHCSLVWCHPLEQCDEIMALSDEQSCCELQVASG